VGILVLRSRVGLERQQFKRTAALAMPFNLGIGNRRNGY
jgi:hypothetical protein